MLFTNRFGVQKFKLKTKEKLWLAPPLRVIWGDTENGKKVLPNLCREKHYYFMVFFPLMKTVMSFVE